MTKNLVTEFSRPEHLADPYLGAWHARGIIDPSLAGDVMEEAYASGQIEPIRETPGSRTNQIFERLIVDFTREHNFQKLEELGRFLGVRAIESSVALFPSVADFQIDEAAIQIYPPDTELALGWHRDHPNDKYLVISAVLAGAGDIGFTEKTYEEAKDGVEEPEVIATCHTEALDAVYFRAKGLFTREDESDIRETHAVTKVHSGQPRFSVQYRMELNAAEYGNTPVNHDAPLRADRLPLIGSV